MASRRGEQQAPHALRADRAYHVDSVPEQPEAVSRGSESRSPTSPGGGSGIATNASLSVRRTECTSRH
eukprot:5679379-Prorocentrum_lima.AAC.1